MWGVDFLYYMYMPVQALFALAAILLFVPGFRHQVRAWVRHLPFPLWSRNRRVWFTRTLMLILALAAFVTLPSARHFLGDGYILIGKLETNTWPNVARAPFSYTVIRALDNVGRGVWQTAENTYRIYSWASGALYILLVFPVAAALGRNKQEKSVVLAFLLTAGFMQLFFGYVEHYALYMPFILLYILTGLRTQEQRMPVYVPALVLGLLLALHQAFAVFGPSLLVLAYQALRHRQVGFPA